MSALSGPCYSQVFNPVLKVLNPDDGKTYTEWSAGGMSCQCTLCFGSRLIVTPDILLS